MLGQILRVLPLCLLLAGCAPQRPRTYSPPPPVIAGPAAAAGASANVQYMLARSKVSAGMALGESRPIDDRQPIYYLQNYGGGGLAVGLLGPLGVLANQQMIESQTVNDVRALNAHIAVDPFEVMESASENVPQLEEAPGAGSYTLNPYVLVVKGEGNRLNFATAIRATRGGWTGIYVAHLTATRDFPTVAAGKGNYADFSQGYTEALKLFVADVKGRLQPGAEVNAVSELFVPRFKLPAPAKMVSEDASWILLFGPGEMSQPTLLTGYHRAPSNLVKITRP